MPCPEKQLAVIGCDTDMIFPSDNNVLRFNYRHDYGAVLVKAGVFNSIKEAWAANYKGQIPTGWNDLIINGVRVYLYNPSEVQWAAPWDNPQSEEHEDELAAALACGDDVWDDDNDDAYGAMYGYPFMEQGYRGWNGGS